MWDDILEIILEGVFEISLDAAGHKSKGILIGLASLAWLAVTTLLLWVGIEESDFTLIGLGIVTLAALILWLFFKIERYQKTPK